MKPTFLFVNQSLLDKLEELALPLLSAQQVELVELLLRRQGRKVILRFLVDKTPPLRELGGSIPVDKPEGITLDECARLNQEIGQILDRENVIQESYLLEVSSPGLDRPLLSTRDFQRNIGRPIRVILHQPLNEQNVWEGLVQGVDEQKVFIQTGEGRKMSVTRKNISRANLELKI